MSWRDWFSIESWFFTTAAAQGLRDARREPSAQPLGELTQAFGMPREHEQDDEGGNGAARRHKRGEPHVVTNLDDRDRNRSSEKQQHHHDVQ